MKILFDTNIILDVFLTREPFQHEAALLIERVVTGKVRGVICADSITTIFYFGRKLVGRDKTIHLLKTLFPTFEIAPIDRAIIDRALNTDEFNDFEDAVIHASALQVGANGIVTRDVNDFKESKLTIYSPKELLSIF